MPRWNKVSDSERKTIEDYLRGGLTVKEISKITGRGKATIERVKYAANGKEAIEDAAVEQPTKEVEKTPELYKDTVRDHRDDPRFATNISVQMLAQIVGNKTGYSYVADFVKKVIRITNTEGAHFDLEFNMVEKFLDEMIDISVEVGDLKKRFN